MFAFGFLLAIALSAVNSKIVTLTNDNHDEYVNKGHIFVKYYSPTCPHCREVAPVFETLSNNFEKYGDRITFAEIDCTKNNDACDSVDVRGYPTFYYFPTNKNNKIEYNGDRSIDDFSEFVGSNVGIFYRPKPKLLKEVTPETWNETVMDPTKNVFVAFTAPWCKHCQRLKPQMEMAAHSFKPEENISFVYIDAEKYVEFTEPYQVRGYPTIKYFPAAGPNDAELAVELEKEEAEKKADREKRAARKAELQALKAAAEAEDATEEAKKAFGDAQVEELDDLINRELEDENIFPPPRKGVQLVQDFTGSRSAANIVYFINAHAGTLRMLGGGVDPNAGIIAELIEPVLRYTHAVTNTSLPKEHHDTPAEEKTEEKKEEEKAAEEETKAAKEEKKTEEEKEERVPPPSVEDAKAAVMAIVKELPSRYVASQFERYMDALEKKGLSYIDSERERVTRLLENGHFTDEKQLQLTVRKNVLSLFMTI